MTLQTKVGHPRMVDWTVAGSSFGHLRLVQTFKRLHVGRRIRASGVSRALSVGGTRSPRGDGVSLEIRKTPINGRAKLDGYLGSSQGKFGLSKHRVMIFYGAQGT